MNNAMNRSNSNGMDDDVINSLGKVLSSVNLVEEANGMGYGGSAGEQHQQSVPGQQQGGQYYGSNSWSGAAVPSVGTSSSSA
jgi:hypothetical protein